MPRARTIEQAARFVDDVGIALVFGKADIVLPSLWEAIGGPGPLEWAVRDETGKFLSFTLEMDRLWRWKDELPERRRACAGRHLARGAAALIARRLIPALYALTGRSGTPEDFRRALARAVRESAVEVSAADVSAPLAWRRKQAATTLDELAAEGIATVV